MKIPISKECIPYVLFCLILFIITIFFSKLLSIIPLALLLFVIYFFRNPERKIINDDNAILSPADGKVMEIKEIYEDKFIKGKAVKISIFLSLFNVHVNRSPISGKVVFKEYRPGKYLPAFKSHASEINERNSIGIENDRIKVIVHQITGFVARRIVCWVNVDDNVERGERFGLIKFGSCTELIVPADVVKLSVTVGQTVKGGETILGRLINA